MTGILKELKKLVEKLVFPPVGGKKRKESNHAHGP